MTVLVVEAGPGHFVQHKIAETEMMKIVSVAIFRQDPIPGVTNERKCEVLGKLLLAQMSAADVLGSGQMRQFLGTAPAVWIGLQQQLFPVELVVQTQTIHEKLLYALTGGFGHMNENTLVWVADHR